MIEAPEGPEVSGLRLQPIGVFARLLVALACVTLQPVSARGQGSAPSVPPALELSAGWEYRWGESPLDGQGLPAWAHDATSSEGWQSLKDLASPEGRNGSPVVWFRLRLPSRAWPNAVLHLPPVLLACEVYLDGQKIQQVGSLQPDRRNRFLTLTRHNIPLPPGYAGKTLAIRVFSNARHFLGIESPPLIGTPEGVLRAVIAKDLDSAVVGVLFVSMGVASLLLYLGRRGWSRVEYLSFGAFATSVGVQPIASSPVFDWVAGSPVVAYYLVFLGFVLFPVGLFAFLAQTLSEGPFRLMRRIWQVHLALAASGLVLDLLDLLPLPELVAYMLPLLALDVVAALVVGNRAALVGTPDVRILNLGAAVLALTGLHDIVASYWFPERRPILLWGAFAFVVLLGYMLERRYAASHHRLEDQARELARTNAELQSEVAVRQTAEEALRRAHADVERLKDRLQAETVYLQEEIKLEHDFEHIVTRSDALRAVLRQVEQVASTDSTVLILGETGTGKELVARAVHSLSARRNRPLVKVNCAALPASLIESELFGHEKGAYTGALSRQLGRFELADGGAIFLDEVGDLPLELQAKLLRVLQEGEFERLGSPKTLRVDVRVVAATNRDLAQAIARGAFRRDLFYRLNVFPIELPPLRDRREDIPLLVQHFLGIFSARCGRAVSTVSPAVMNALQAYAWPGNVRELENVIERAVVISRGPRLELGDWLPKPDAAIGESPLTTLAAVEEEHIRRVLQATGWRVSGDRGAATILGLKRTTLEARMRRLGIVRAPPGGLPK